MERVSPALRGLVFHCAVVVYSCGRLSLGSFFLRRLPPQETSTGTYAGSQSVSTRSTR